MNNKGQAVLAEHAMIFFVVIAALTAMTVLVQRGLQARVHDVRDYMINAVNSACDANCQQAAGGSSVPYEYEPYYVQTLSEVNQNSNDVTGTMTGNPKALGVIYKKVYNEKTGTQSTGVQLPPECAGGQCPVPSP